MKFVLCSLCLVAVLAAVSADAGMSNSKDEHDQWLEVASSVKLFK